VFFLQFLAVAHVLQGRFATKWLKIEQDNVQTGTAKAVARLTSFAQITC